MYLLFSLSSSSYFSLWIGKCPSTRSESYSFGNQQIRTTIKQDGGDGVGTNGAGGWWGLGGVMFPRLETLESKVGGAYISTRGENFFIIHWSIRNRSVIWINKNPRYCVDVQCKLVVITVNVLCYVKNGNKKFFQSINQSIHCPDPSLLKAASRLSPQYPGR
jgi:hypothetical protein